MNWKNKLMKKPMPGLLLLCALIGLAGCYNNAHLRTQQLLEPGEKVVSGSGVLALGMMSYGDLYYTGVSGFRGEVSYLSGKRWGESGPYIGLGLHLGALDIIAGYEIKRYIKLNTAQPWKLGLQAEGNLNFGAADYGSGRGFALHLRPSFTSTTTKERPFYSGLHGLFSLGSLESRVHREEITGYDEEYGYPIYNWYEEDVGYQFYSFGAGVTAGFEAISPTRSIQAQVDASWVRGHFSSEEYTPSSEYPTSPSSSFFMLTGSVGMNFFRPKPSPRRPTGPYPAAPVPPKEVLEAPAPGEPQPQFDPETGLPQADQQPDTLRFDPVTGLPVEEETEPDTTPQFDPETGLPVKAEPEAPAPPQFDPETGELIPPEPAEPEPVKIEVAAGEVGFEATLENVIATAEAEAVRSHNAAQHRILGAVGCLFTPITFFYVESGASSGFDKNSASSAAAYYRGLSPERQFVYEQAYKNKEKSLRRRSVYGTQLGCWGAWMGYIILMTGGQNLFPGGGN